MSSIWNHCLSRIITNKKMRKVTKNMGLCLLLRQDDGWEKLEKSVFNWMTGASDLAGVWAVVFVVADSLFLYWCWFLIAVSSFTFRSGIPVMTFLNWAGYLGPTTSSLCSTLLCKTPLSDLLVMTSELFIKKLIRMGTEILSRASSAKKKRYSSEKWHQTWEQHSITHFCQDPPVQPAFESYSVILKWLQRLIWKQVAWIQPENQIFEQRDGRRLVQVSEWMSLQSFYLPLRKSVLDS